jgi:cell division septation protein DedD
MNIQRWIVLSLIAAASLLWQACTSTEESTSQTSGEPSREIQKTTSRVDTVQTAVESSQKPSYEAKSPVGGSPAGKFSVQVGAYKMPDNAERIGSLAKERFGKNVYTVHDAGTDLYKVLVGDFFSKDDARNFRDEMVRQYPADYKDAWVFENTQK